MKNRALMPLAASFVVAQVVHAASLQWDGIDPVGVGAQGGAATWDMNTTANWWDSAADVVWPNSGTDNDAVFAGAAGVVTLSGVIANDLSFSTSGYTLSSSTLTLNGTTPTITTAAGIQTAITAPIGGSDGLTKAGPGRLALSAANGYTGGTVIKGGLITITGDGTGATNPLGAYPGAFQASNITLNGGGGFASAASAIGAASSAISMSANRGIELGAGLQTFVRGWRASLTVNGIISGSGGLIITENAEYNNGSTGGGSNTSFGGNNTYTGDTVAFDLGTQDPPFNPGTNGIKDSTFDYNTTLVPATNGFTFNKANSSPNIGGLKGNKNLALVFQGGGVVNIGNNNKHTIYIGALTNGGSKCRITKIGTGTLQLGGVNTLTDGVTVTTGRLVETATGSSLGTQAVSGNNGLTVSTDATFAFLPAVAGPLTLGQGKLTLANNSTIGTAVGGTANQSAITSTVAAVTSGAVNLDISGIPGVAVTSGSNNLISDAAGGLDGASYTLGKIYNATNFSVTAGSLVVGPNAVAVTVASQSALGTVTWKGGYSGGNNVWALGDGLGSAGTSNWTTDGSTATGLIPGNGADVVFTNANSPSNQSSMVLGANMAIRSLTVGSTGAVTLDADGNSLNIVNAAGITVNSGALTINSFLTLGASQTWTNNSASPLVIGGDITNASNNLTIAGSGDVTISGQLRYGTGALNMNGSGTLTLSGDNVSYKGNTTVNSGIVKAGSPYAFGMAISQIIGIPYGWGYANVAFGAASTGKVQLNGNNVVISSLSTNASVGTPIVENASATPVTLSVTEATSTATAATHTFAGVIQDGTGGGSLGLQVTKGTLTLKGVNTYTGDTIVSGGTLTLFDDAGLTVVVTNNGNSRIRGAGTVNLNGDLTINTAAVSVLSGAWSLVDVATLTESFSPTFTVAGAGWMESADVWTKVDGSKTWTFTEATGVLSLVDSGGGAPEIVVEDAGMNNINDGGSKAFGTVVIGSSTTQTFTIKNIGSANLTGLVITPSGSTDFSVTATPTAPVAGPSGTTSFTVQFAPTSTGPINAHLQISNNDSGEDPFDIDLSGTGTTAYDVWANTTHSLANPAFNFDSDKDCLENGIEWVLGGNPNANDNPSVLPTVTGSTVGGLTLVFNRNSASIPETTLVVEWGSVLSGFANSLTIGTSDVGPSGDNPTIDIDAPSAGKVTVNIPAANAVGGKILVRLKATRP